MYLLNVSFDFEVNGTAISQKVLTAIRIIFITNDKFLT